MRKFIFITLLMISIVVSSFAFGSKEIKGGIKGDYEFGGSTTLDPIFMAAIEHFNELYEDLNLSYDSQGSSVGVIGVLNGVYSLGGSSRELKDKEVEDGAVATPIALDGVAVIANKNSVNIANLSIGEVAEIYSGEITNWSEVGGPDEDIIIFNRDEASGTRSCFDDLTVKLFDMSFTNTAAIVSSNGDMVSKVGSTPYSIGYCGFGYIGKDANTKIININGISPEAENVINGTYPIARKLNVISNGNIEKDSFEEIFVNFLLSDHGQSLVEEEGFIKLK